MKKTTLLLSLFAAVIFLSSCNKNKDEIEELQKQVADLQNQSNTQSSLVPTSAPISVQFTGNRGFDSAAVSFNSNYLFSWNTPNTAGEFEWDGSEYDFYMWRGIDISSNDYAEIEIDNYDPTGSINDAQISVYFERHLQPADTNAVLEIDQYGYLNSGGTDNITVNSFSFNPDTRAFSIDLTITATEATPQNSTNNPATSRVTFSGTLSSDDYVYKQAVKN